MSTQGNIADAEDGLGIYVLDVGQGDATVVLPPGARAGAVVFDCKDGNVVRKLLEHWKIEQLAALVLSHLDLDHIAGCADLLERFPTQTVYVCADRDLADTHEDAQKAKGLIDQIRSGAEEGRWVVLPSTADPRPLLRGDDWSVQIVAPPFAGQLRSARAGGWDDANRYSSVLRVERGGRAVLVGGDAPLRTWSEIPAPLRKADAFRVPHHGGALDDGGVPADWDTARLYRESGSSEVMISVGSNNPHGHPSPDWTHPFLLGQRRLRCTQVTERCQAGLQAGGVENLRREILRRSHFAEPPWRHMTNKRGALRRDLLEVPCAGTIVITLYRQSMRVLPAADGDHARVIDGWLRPQCRPPTAMDELIGG